MLAGVIIACYPLVHLEMLGYILDQRAQGRVVLLALWHIETLQKIQIKSILNCGNCEFAFTLFDFSCLWLELFHKIWSTIET